MNDYREYDWYPNFPGDWGYTPDTRSMKRVLSSKEIKKRKIKRDMTYRSRKINRK